MNRRKILIVGLIALAAIATIALADVIYVYQGTITATTTKAPLTFSTGPNGQNNYITFTGTNTGFTANIELTNSYAAYFYQAGELTVNTGGTLYVSSVSTSTPSNSGSPMINTMIIYIVPQSSSSTQEQQQQPCIFTVINGGEPTTPSSTCTLSAGSYYINIYVEPNTPVANTYSEAVIVNFGFNVIGSEAVSIPSS